MPDAPFQILLYYLYTPLADPAGYLEEHRELCTSLGLRGRILIAREGINGTVSGPEEATAAYRRALEEDSRMAGIVFKCDPADGHAFPRLSIKLRDEVVTLGLGADDFSPRETTGAYLSPDEWRAMMGREDVVLLDARNDYEWEAGHFAGAILPPVRNFRELPDWVRRHREEFAGKKILTYCTGGIRCEKFSGFLRREGFPEVYQLEGGIVSYGKDPEVQGEGFEGKCYVFDERVAVEVNHTAGATVVSRCRHCDARTDRYVNCGWSRCNAQHFSCEACAADGERFCNPICREAAVVSLAAETNEGL